jgi:hypothetical protein
LQDVLEKKCNVVGVIKPCEEPKRTSKEATANASACMLALCVMMQRYGSVESSIVIPTQKIVRVKRFAMAKHGILCFHMLGCCWNVVAYGRGIGQ